MRNPILLSCLLAIAMAPHAAAQSQAPASVADVRYAGGDGLTVKKAIVIAGAKTASEGEAAEQEWIRRNLPGASIQSQGRVTGPPHYDVITVKLATGERRDIHFDITAFFGK
ncbi:MAG TPA: hypothetical protein VIT22_01680 [Pseudoxanthomonas sp.]